MVYPVQGKMQPDGIWSKPPKSIAKEKSKQREVKRIFKILREVWLNIGVEKINMHKRVTVKALLDSSATSIFMDRKMVARNGF